jgi:hypothetical protein
MKTDKMTTRTLEIKTNDAELQHTLPLTSADGETLTLDQLQTTAASLLLDNKDFSLCYTDSDGDRVTIASGADVKELCKYMEDEQLQSLEVLAVAPEPTTNAGRAPTAVQTQLRGLVTAMSKLTAKPETKPTPASAMNLLVATLQAIDVADDAEELATIKKELLLVLQDEDFRKNVEELSATEEFKDLADATVAAIYAEDAQAIEDAATTRFDELLVFAQRLTARCPSLKPAMVRVAKSLMAGLVRYNDEDVDGSASDASSCSSSSSCCSDDQETVDVEVLADHVPLHMGVECSGCAKTPLVGTRYKSLEVRNFDLCEDCEASGKYVRYEPFIKITDPSRAPKQKRTSEPLVHPFVTCDGCEMTPIAGVRFKSQTKDDFDLCEACEASGKWTETHGPFTKMEEPVTMRALKFTCRRGGKFGHHGKFGKFGHHHGHGHHGKFGDHDGKFGRPHCCHGKFGRREDEGSHHGKFGRHGRHHGPPGFDFHGPHPAHHGPPEFAGHGFAFAYGGCPNFTEGGRPDVHGHHDHGPAFEERRRHHGPRGFGPPGCFGGFGHFGPPPFEFMDPRGPPMCPRGFEHGRPPFPADFEHFGRHGHHGRRHGRHTRFTDDDGKDDKQDEEWQYYHRHHGCHGRGRGRWGRYAPDGAQEAGDAASRAEGVADEGMEIIDSAEVKEGEEASADPESKVDYSDNLAQLASMGFSDTEKNVRALEVAGGNIGGAVNMLLSE